MSNTTYNNRYSGAIDRPTSRKRKVAKWILENKASVISHPVEAGLRDFANGCLACDQTQRKPFIRRKNLAHTVQQVINEFEAAVPH